MGVWSRGRRNVFRSVQRQHQAPAPYSTGLMCEECPKSCWAGLSCGVGCVAWLDPGRSPLLQSEHKFPVSVLGPACSLVPDLQVFVLDPVEMLQQLPVVNVDWGRLT